MVSRFELLEKEKNIRNDIRHEMEQKIRQIKDRLTVMLATTTTTTTTTESTTSTIPDLIIGGP